MDLEDRVLRLEQLLSSEIKILHLDDICEST
jgi:hypothetical protein